MKIAFGYQSRVGKDTACAYLKEKYGGYVHSFSQSLYDILYYAQDVCGFERKKDTKFLQWVGTEWARAQDPNVWINNLLKKIDTNENVYISDVRYLNEANALHDKGFLLIKIEKSDRIIDRNVLHSSETELQNYTGWDYIIYNNSDYNNLYSQLELLLKNYF